jgi:ABC-type dipeptide/oligopeptide/nickel transport system permease subunit
MIGYRLLTELTVVGHLLFIVFVVVGGFIVRRRRWLAVVHLAAVAWAVYAELTSGVVCPLTALENLFGLRAGLVSYEGDFITRYLIPVIYPEGLTRLVQYVLAAVVLAVNGVAYLGARKR